MKRFPLVPLFAALAFVGLLFASAPSHAQSAPVTRDVYILVGSSGGASSSLPSSIKSALERQFRQFDSFNLHGRHTVRLNASQPQKFSLPGGGELTLTLVAGSGGASNIEISFPGARTTRSTREGLVFLGGTNVPGGKLIIAIADPASN